MAERGPRPALDFPPGESPVPAGYGSLGGGIPRTRVERSDPPPRDRRPFRWWVWREGAEEADRSEGESLPAAPQARVGPAAIRPRQAPADVEARGPEATSRARPAPEATSRARPAPEATSKARFGVRVRPGTPGGARTRPPGGPTSPPAAKKGATGRPSRSVPALRPPADTEPSPLPPSPPHGAGPAASAPWSDPADPARTAPSTALSSGGWSRPVPVPGGGQTTARAGMPEAEIERHGPRSYVEPEERRRRPVRTPRPPKPKRRARPAPPVPRRRVDAAGRVRSLKDKGSPEPEARPVAYLENTIRARQTVRHVDTWMVLRMSLIFYFFGLIVMVLAGVVLWNVASALGTIHSIDKSIKTLFDLKTFTLKPLAVLAYGTGLGVALMFLGTIINVLASVLFNLIADVSGGVAMLVVAEPDNS